jgi:glucan phosphorylase
MDYRLVDVRSGYTFGSTYSDRLEAAQAAKDASASWRKNTPVVTAHLDSAAGRMTSMPDTAPSMMFQCGIRQF